MALVPKSPRWNGRLSKRLHLSCDGPGCAVQFFRSASQRRGDHDFCSQKCAGAFKRRYPPLPSSPADVPSAEDPKGKSA